jgi:hypothetical protein
MSAVKFEESNVGPSERGGYTLASCDPYWAVLGVFRDTPGYIWHWAGMDWTDTWHGMLLYDRDGAREVADLLHAAQVGRGIVRAVNLADYVRFDRQRTGYPRRHHWAASRYPGSAEALTEVYEAMTVSAPQGEGT